MKTILLIEDNDILRENTAEILELTGYRVVTAENGKIGVEKALAERPDLVICDIMMPVLDGYGVLHIFNKNPNLSGIPFIFLTAKTERSDFRQSMAMGADDYITKPFSETELLAAIEARFNRFQNHINTIQSTQEEEATIIHRLSGLIANRRVHAVKKKQFIYTEQDEPARLYYLQSGKVKTVRTNAEGKELITGLFLPGDFFGYLSLLQHIPYADSAVTIDDSELIYIPQEDFEQHLKASSHLSRDFMELLAKRVSSREERLVGMAYNSLRRRVADTLLYLHDQQITDADDDVLIQLSRDNLASIVGTATESLIRTLSEFKQSGLIELSATGIRLLQPDTLRRANW